MTMRHSFHRSELDLSSFPDNLQMNIKPEAPPPMKMMAASGMSPAPPEFTPRILYVLKDDGDKQVSQKAVETASGMPANVLAPALQAEQPPSVLDWFAELRQDKESREAIALNKATDDLTVAYLAGHGDARLCDTIANNQMRILRSPVILEEMYKNPNARMSTVDKLVDLAQRNDVELTGLPGLQDALEQGEDIGLMVDVEDAQEEEEYAAFLAQQQQIAQKEEQEYAQKQERLENMTRMERERLERAERDEHEDEEEDLSDKPIFVQLQAMNVAKKIRAATIGSREMVLVLLRESNRLVHMAAIRSPRLKYNDIKKLASNKSLPDGVVRYIANNKDWTSKYDIKVALVSNPKTPLADAMGFMNHLRTNDLRQLQRNRNVSHQIARQAKNLLNKRQGRR